MTDGELIRAVRKGHPGAFETLYRRHKDAVFRYACALSGSVADGEDLLQEAFFGLLRNIDGFDVARPLLPYLLQAVRRRQVDRLRSFASRGRQLSAADEPACHQAPERNLMAEERAAALYAALETLPPEQRDALTLRVFGGLSYEAIAKDRATPQATVRTRYRAAVAKLRQVLGRRVAHD